MSKGDQSSDKRDQEVRRASEVARQLSDKWQKAGKGTDDEAGRTPVLTLLTQPLRQFFAISASGGIMLLIATAAALFWANSPWHETYHHFWETDFQIKFGPDWTFDHNLHFLVNDVLMSIFFFLVGLEIKREIIAGELSSIKNATLPIFAAVGGMVVPALVYLGLYAVLETVPQAERGWGIPMATDIAFSLGILQLLGNRVPVSFKVFLTAFAIVDDLGAILVIAVAYTAGVDFNALAIAGGLTAVLIVFNRFNVRNIWLYALIGIAIWYQFLVSGIHPTVAGVLVAITIPANPKINLRGFTQKMTAGLFEFRRAKEADNFIVLTKPQIKSVDYMRTALNRVQSPVQRLENTLHNFVIYVIMPIFALANAGVTLTQGGAGIFVAPVTMMIMFGLLAGKLIGITAFSWLSVRTGLGTLPTNAGWRHIIGLSLMGGIGFTMSLFIAGLAFDEAGTLNQAKIGILMGSFLSGIGGYVWLDRNLPKAAKPVTEDFEKEKLRSKTMLDER